KSSASLSKARLIRTNQEQREEIPLDLRKILKSQRPDMLLQAGDIIFVPGSLTRGMGRRSLETILSTASGVAIYSRPCKKCRQVLLDVFFLMSVSLSTRTLGLTAPLAIAGRKIRLAIVGCGRISKNHFSSIGAHAHDLELAGVCDTDAERLEAAVSKHGVPG